MLGLDYGNSQNQKLEDILSMINGLSDEFNAAADNNSKVLDGNVLEELNSLHHQLIINLYTIIHRSFQLSLLMG